MSQHWSHRKGHLLLSTYVSLPYFAGKTAHFTHGDQCSLLELPNIKKKNQHGNSF